MTQAILHSKHFVPERDLAQSLVETYGSPVYVYDGAHLEREIKEVSSSIKYERTRFAFASVTNGNINLLRKFKQAGWGLHANTPGDAFLGLEAGFTGADIVYSGSNLAVSEMEQMLAWQVGAFNLDSISQLRQLGETLQRVKSSPPRIGFRLNLPEITGESRIGISPGDLIEAQHVAAQYGLDVTGVHFYRGTSTNATERFSDCIGRVIEVCQNLHNWRYLDFGGGFGFPYYDRRQSFEWNEFGAQLTDALGSCGSSVDLIIEPGRSVIAGCAAMVCKVVSVKWQGDKQIVGVDATTSNVAVLSVHGGTRQVRHYKALSASDSDYPTDVCGNTTYSRDYISRSCRLPQMSPGDILAILDCGAYGYAMSSHFLHRPRLAEILLGNGSCRLIRHAESLQCLLANQVYE